MCAQLSDLFNTIKEKDKSPNFRDALNKYLYHWPLFLLGLTITTTGTYFYLQAKPPVYDIKATVIIKDEKKESDEKEKLQELELSNSPKLAENELEVFKSRNLIGQVVDDLHLWVTYHKKNGLKTEDLYKKTPVVFRLLDSTGNIDKQVFKIKIRDSDSFLLIKSDGSLQQFLFKDILKNSFGTWELQPMSNLKKFEGSEITIALSDPNKVAESFQKAIDVDMPNKLAPVLELDLKDNVEPRGKDILNHLITLYNETTIAEKNKITQNTLDFIDNRIVSLTDELNNSEKDIEGYRSSKGLTDISSQSRVYLENVQSNNNKIIEVNDQLNKINDIEKNLNSLANLQNASAALGSNYPLLNGLITDLGHHQSEREKLLSTTPENNPVFDPVNNQIKLDKINIITNIKIIKSSLLSTINQLESFKSKSESSIRNVPVQERELIDKTRPQSIKQDLYIYLLQKREEISLNYAAILPDARIVDYAYSSSATSSGVLVYGAAFLFGLLIPAGFIYGRNSLNNRITTRKEIEDAIEIPIFGELSFVKSASTLVALGKNNIAIGEEFRDMRTNLHFLIDKQKKGWVTLLTSSISNEGKSFVSSNLGLVLAASGKKSIILEMDLRRPKILGIFNLSATHPGISNYITGESSIEEIIQNSDIYPNLDIIGSGFPTTNPSELLEREEIDSLINWLRFNYDYIIIDTPPVNLVTDAKILSRVSDVILYIIRQNYTYKSLLPFIKLLNKQQQFHNMKIVFNSIEKGRYGYGYNYGHEYYQKISDSKKNNIRSAFNDFFKRF